MFIIGVIFFSIAITFFSGAITAIIYDSLKMLNKEKEAKKYLGKYRSAPLVAAIFIPPVASFIAKDLLNSQFIILLIINLIGYLIALIFASTLYEPPYSKKKEKIAKLNLLKESFHQIKNKKSLLKLDNNKVLVFVCVLIFISLLWQPYFRQAKIPVILFGSIFAISSIINFFLFRNIEKIERFFGFKSTIFFTSFSPGVFLLLMVIFINPLMAILGFFAISILLPIRDPLFMDYKNRHIKSYNRATTISIIAMFYSLLAIILQPIIGFRFLSVNII